MITRTRFGKKEVFRSDAYQEEPRVDRLKSTLTYFGFGRLEARYLARDIIKNLDNYVKAQDIVYKQLSDNLTPRPTQTSGGRYSG